MSETPQQIARRVLADLDSLVAQGKLQSFRLDAVRSELEPLANPPPPPVLARKPPPVPAAAPRKRYRAIWSYDGTEADELSFAEADTVELVQEVSDGWWKGAVVRADGTRSDEGLFPSNYVEVLPDSVPALPPRYNPSSPGANANTDDEKRAMGLHASPPPPMNNMPSPYGGQGQQLGPPRWQPGVARWSSGAPPMPPPPPSNFASSPGPQSPHAQNGSYYDDPSHQQQPVPYGGAPSGPNGLQPYVPTEEDKKKHANLKKYGSKMSQAMAGGFAGGVGFGIGSHLF